MESLKGGDNLSKRKIIVGLDFGTTFSGFAHAHTDDPEKVYANYVYPGGVSNTYPKTLTSSFYVKQGETGVKWQFENWGYGAREANSRNNRNRKAKVPAVYLTKFKLHLASKGFGAPSATPLPQGLTVDVVITDYLRRIGELIVNIIRDGYSGELTKKNIQWCVTVPSIWNNDAKAVMKSCMTNAGLVGGVDGSHHPLILVLEPEAASFHCYKVMKEQILEVGDKILVADIGGGTSDIVVQEVVSVGECYRVKELTTSSGGLCGGSYVDSKFMEFLHRKIGPCLQNCIDKYPEVEETLIKNWEVKKTGFGLSRESSTFVGLPSKLATEWEEQDDKNGEFGREYDEVEITDEEMQSIFDPIVDQNLALIADQLVQANGVKIIVVVGGFAESKYLMGRIKARFKEEVPHIIHPPNPASAVSLGAVALAFNPGTIVSRVSRKTYGFHCLRNFEKGVDPPEYLELIDGVSKCYNRFSVYVRKGDIVYVDDCISKTFFPGMRGQQKIQLQLFSSDEINPRYTVGETIKKEGEIEIDISSDMKLDKKREVKVSLFFGRSSIEIKAEAMNFISSGPQQLELPVVIGYNPEILLGLQSDGDAGVNTDDLLSAGVDKKAVYNLYKIKPNQMGFSIDSRNGCEFIDDEAQVIEGLNQVVSQLVNMKLTKQRDSAEQIAKVTDEVLPEPQVVVGLDFGTMHSGFAYAQFNNPQRIYTHWDYPNAAHEAPSCKTLTSNYYKRQSGGEGRWQLMAWGNSAYALYARDTHQSNLVSDTLSHPTIGMYVSRFKLHLTSRATGSSSLAPPLPPGLTLEVVITDYLREMGALILETLKKHYGDEFTKKMIQWCVTVPSTWDNATIVLMKYCLTAAGLVNGVDGSPHPFVVVLEPEAISFSCHNVVLEDKNLEAGDKILVVDIIEGTTDVVVQEVDSMEFVALDQSKRDKSMDDVFRVKEVTSHSEPLCFYSYLNAGFMEFLHKAIGPCLGVCLNHHPKIFAQLTRLLEPLMSTFGDWTTDGDSTEISLPKILLKEWERYDKREGKFARESYDELEISYEEMQSIFDPVVEQLVGLIAEQLEVVGGFKVLVLSGRLAEVPYVMEYIRRIFGGHIPQIISPSNPDSAVCQGAVAMVLNRGSAGMSKTCRKTYGFKGMKFFERGVDPDEYLLEINGVDKCANHFQVFVKKGETVTVDSSISKICMPTQSGQKKMKVELVSSDKLDPRYTIGETVRLEGEIELDISEDMKLDQHRAVKLTVYFRKSSLEVVAEAVNFVSSSSPQHLHLPAEVMGYY
ncbi:uncharacterized protein [Physcomitrium patens]|uniref:Uncharacterized protein n=1 Tax=Physcomitrium patens TaxID=3218 RepID=A9RME9_PHYPA|nr:uncharacterized protein LOC112295078 [Physcomitrium patens]XP_024402002.1 uncharacterized protein LOC112295078 [Physcomitrium patens]XP_024402003.1 uncharacterized protein LOC112295078 [Physcomitrium patens]XP_024402004.1 uncharacterized protein LOC112295078 [Physcomitrium patens]XP_024402005.1 uncharacterized protein LOC112295078 [Physcomitrium patens]XP_024402006.1 uncharacterized protein LOC112295078 [Physcomitrium patens]XP_024402007.1 uncharacterized protein LOC112295078 [Physcomitriu|eukprot:XP_024402001.1 uncharacterized protein LOC112295078 [Physcomitrella patens]